MIFNSKYIAYWKHSNFNNISLVLGIVYGLRFNGLFKFIKSLRKHNQYIFLGLGCVKDWSLYYESFDLFITSCSTSFFTFIIFIIQSHVWYPEFKYLNYLLIVSCIYFKSSVCLHIFTVYAEMSVCIILWYNSFMLLNVSLDVILIGFFSLIYINIYLSNFYCIHFLYYCSCFEHLI